MVMVGGSSDQAAVYADSTDIAEVWRPLSADEIIKATALCKRASVILRQKVAAVDDRIAAGSLDAALVNQVVTDWVVAVMRNPDGFTQENEGGYGYSRFGVAASTGLLMSSIPDLTILQPESATMGSLFVGSPLPKWAWGL